MIQHLHRGGTEDHFFDLVTGIDRVRFQPHVIHFNHSPGDVAQKLALDPGVRVTYLPVGRAYDLSALSAMRRVRAYLRRHEIRAVVTYHFVADFIGTLASVGRALPPVISSRRDTGFTRTPRQLRIGPWLDRGVRRYIAVSDAVRQSMVAAERLDSRKIDVIHNGIDIAEFESGRRDAAAERARLGLAPDELVIGCVANLNPIKNHLMLLEAFARLRAQNPALACRLLLAGDGPMRGEIEARVRALGLGEAVILAGFSHDVTREFQLSDLVVLASETEGLSNSLIKGMALEKPVVACRVGGNPEVVVEGETGLLVESRNAEAFAAALGRLALDPALRCRMGQAGARRVRECFTKRAMIQKHEDLLARVIDGHTP